MKNFLRATLLSLGLVAFGCSAPAEQTETDEGHSAVRSEALKFEAVLPELAAKGISGTVKKLFDPRLAEAELEVENRYYLEVSFGRISEAHYKTIGAFFGGRSKVPYDARRSYDLTDFLHPAMQAVVNQTFTPEEFSGDALLEHAPPELADDAVLNQMARYGVGILSNCFNTTIEMLRQVQPGRRDAQYLLFFPDRDKADGWFSKDEYSDEVRPADVKPGDALVVKERNVNFGNTPMLAHTAILLSKELVFEKTDSSDADPYRVSLRKDVLALYERMMEDKLVVQYRRFNGPGKKPFPVPSVPTNELDAKVKDVVRKAYPRINPDNVTLSVDLPGAGGGFVMSANEIQPATVVINPRTGRGIFKAAPAVLGRFVPLKGR